MMIWSFFLHFYQPYYQQDDILDKIVNESYRPLMKIFLDNPKAKATFNISASLLELLAEKGYEDVIESLRQLLSNKQIELTGTAAYHAFLPLMPEKEIRRQINLNTEISRRIIGESLYKPKGFFSPELAYSHKVSGIIQDMGFSWTVAPELSYGPQPPFLDKIYQAEKSHLQVFFRHKRSSVLILSGIIRSMDNLHIDLEDLLNEPIYFLPIMDAETFGHHRPGLEDFLQEALSSEEINPVCVSDLDSLFNKKEEVSLREATWSNEEQDFWLDREQGVVSQNPFLLWRDPSNPIHEKQWAFLEWVIHLVGEKAKNDAELRDLLDRAEGSDPFWWASAKPWWSLEMIETGAFRLKEIIYKIPGITEEEKKKADSLYSSILELAFDWQRSGKIRNAYREAQDWQSVPFKDRTPPDWFNLMILEFEDEMNKASGKREYEKAIKWRDAIFKLKKGTDVYDVMHVVNELHSARKLPSLKAVADHKPEEISDFARNHFVPMENLPGKKSDN